MRVFYVVVVCLVLLVWGMDFVRDLDDRVSAAVELSRLHRQASGEGL